MSTVKVPDTLDERYAQVRDRVAEAARAAGRRPREIITIAVTKYAELDDARRLVELGHRDFGESRAGQLAQRAAVVGEWFDRLKTFRGTVAERDANLDEAGDLLRTPNPEEPVRWHMVGHLQRNKARKIAEVVRLVHSVDSLRLAEELQAVGDRKGSTHEVLIQVNCSGEASKHGCAVPAALPLAEQIETMFNVRVRGLMTMAPYSENPEDARPSFARCRELFDEIQKTGLGEGRFNLLSMGMSGDFAVAIEEGANLIRLGSAIFGERAPGLGDRPEAEEPDGDGEAGDDTAEAADQTDED